MTDLSLTDWDCFIIRRAIPEHMKISVDHPDAYPFGSGNNATRMVSAYKDVINNRHHVTWHDKTVRQIHKFVSQTKDEALADGFSLDDTHDPHYFDPVLKKLDIQKERS